MPLDRNKLKQLYSTLQKGGYSQSYDQFENGFTGNNNYANRKKVYDLLTANGAQIGNSYEDFMKRIYTPGATPQRQAPPQQRRAAAPAKSNNGGSGFQFDPNFGKQSQETFFNGGRQTHVGGKYDPIEAGRRQYRASQANNPTVKRQAAQGNPHAKKAVEQGVKAQKEIEGEEAQSRQRRTGQTPQQQARVDASLQIDPEKASKRIQQKMDEAAYMAETGKELKNPVEIGTKIGENGEVIGDPLIAPTLAREENGNIQRGANGEPLIGASSDAERTNAYKQTLVERQKPTIDERINEAEEERERLEEQLKKRGAELDAQNEGSVWRDLPRGGGAGVHTINSTDVNGRNTDTEYLDLLAAQKKVDEQLRDLKAARDEKTGTFLGGAWRGFRDYAFDLSNWDGGYRDLLTSSAMLRSKYGVPKTKREKAAERSMMENTYKADNAAQEAEDALGNGYRFMRIGAQSLPFALNFMAGNLTGITSGIARAGEALGVKAARNIAIKQGANNILRNLGRSVLRNTGVMLGDLGASTALTTTMQAGQTASDIFNRHVGNVTYDPKTDDYNLENGKSLGRSIYEGVANSTIENYTEMLGEHMHFGKFAKWGLNKIGLGKVSDWFTKVCKTDFMQGVNKYLEMGGFNGYPQEVAEEEVGIPLHAIFDGGNQFSDLKDKRQQLDIVGGMLFSMAGMGAGSLALNAGGKVAHKAGMAIQYQQDQHNLNNADKVASFRLTDEKWQPLKEKIDDTTNDDFGKVMSGILSDKSLAPQEKSAVWDYAQRMLIMRGHNMGQVAATKNGMTDQATNASNESFEAGYNAGSEDLNRIKAAYDNARSQAEQTFSPEDLKKIDDDPVSYLRDLGDGEGSQYTRQAVMEYSNAKTAYDGMIQRAKDDLDSKLQDVNMTIDSHVQSADNGGDGMIHPITMKGQNDNGTDKKAYIISGNVVMTDDGTMVDDKKSSPSIIIRNEDGSIEMTSPDRILSVDEPLDPETERKQAVESVQQQFAQERANEIDGTLGFAEGDNYQVIGSDNAEHSVNVIQDNGDGTVTAVWDGHTDQPVQLSKDDVQQMSDAYRLQQYSQEQEEANQEEKEAESQEQQPDEQEAEDELPAGTPRETISYEPDMEMKPEVGNSVYVTDKDGNMVHGEVTQTDDLEGKYLVRTDKKVNGKLVQPFNQEEILYEVHRMKPQEEESPQIIDSGENGGESGGVNGGENTDEEQKPQRAIDLIPSQEVDDGKGNVRTVHQWEQAEPGNTYDALTEIYHGNADRVKKGIDNRVGKIDKAIKGVQKKMDAIDNSDDFDEVAAQSDQYDQLQQQKDALEQQKKYWQSVSRVPQSRKMEADRRTAEEKAAAKAAQEKAEAEAAEKARQEREQVNGVPDVVNDIPADARKRGFRNVNGMVVSRQGETQGVTGRESNVKFSSTDTAKGHIKVIDADELQPSHVSGQRNPAFFIDEAQPKDRTDTVSSMAAAKIASNLNPEEITGDGSAYQFSAPTVNSRGEVIQGNNRSDALKLMYSSAAFKPAQDAYKQYIADHAEEFGFTPEDVAKIQQMEHPVMVNELDVPDDEAIRLGQMRASDNESGGIERIDPVTTSQKLGTKVSNFASVLLSSPDEDAPLSDVLMQNGAKAVKWLQSQGAISDTAAQSAFDKKGNLTPEVRMDLQNILKQSLFQGGVSDLSTMFDKMPAKAQKAILSTFMRDFDSAESERILPEIQKAIEAWYGCAMANDAFAKASNYKAAKAAMHDWTLQTNLLDDNMPSDKFSNFAMELACRLQGCTMRETQQNLNDFFDLVQGKSQGDLFGGTTMGEQADRQESIRRIFNIEYKPISNNNGKGTSNNVADNSSQSREGRQGSKADSSGRERAEGGEQPAASAGGTEKADEQKAEITHVDTRGHGSRTYIKEGGKTTIIFGEGNKVQYHGGEYTVGKRNDDGTYELINGTNVQAFSNAKTEEIKPAETAAQPIGNTSSSEKVEAERQGVNTEPSEKQKEAGNYKKGHIKVDGYDITIENPKGSVREKKDANGKVLWRTPMHYDYGYILGTKGTDGDHIDVYLSDIPTSGNVYVVDQIDQKTGKFDEHKVMYGFPSKEAAIDAYKSQYEKGWKVGTVTEVSREDFKKWVDSSKRKTKPFSEYKSVKTVEEPQSVGTGDFGPIYDQFKGKPKEAINFLLKKKDGEAIGALHHKDIGDIDLVWGKEGTGHSDGYGLAKLAKFHPEVLDNLQDILDDMHVTKRTENRVQLESDTHQATVRLTWNDKKKTWLLTAFEKKNSALDNTTDTAKTSDIGKRNDTATPQSTVSEGKDKQSSSKKQEKGEKNNQGQFGLVSDKRMEELKKRLRDKLNNLNMGVDPEVIAIGLELTTGYIDRGIKKFADYAKVMINDLGEVVRPYLKAFYNGVREMPEITSNGLDKEMDDYDTVSKFNVATIGNEGNDVHPSILDTAEQVSNESHVEKEAQKVSDDDVEKEREKGKMEMHEVDTDKLFNDLKAGKSAKLSDYYKDKEVDAAQQRPTDSIEARPAQGTATTTDEGLVRTHERTSLQSGEKGDVKQMKAGGGVVSVSKREAALRDAVMDLEREAGLDVIDDVEEGQRVLDMVNGEAKLMGSRTNKKMANIGEALEGRELTERQQKVVDVFRGKSDNTPIEVERADGKVRVIMRQGNDEKAGTKHSLYGHYGTNKGVITDEDILIIPDVLARGERTPKMRGNTQLYEYTLNGENGTRYTVLTEKKHSREEFADFYTNKKTSQSARKTRSEEARDIDNNDVSSAKLQQNSDTFKEMSGKIREQRVYHGSAADFDAFDTMNHLSEGEGNQAFGAGTYVADQKDLGMKYANIAYDNDHNKQIAHWNGERLIKRFPTVEDFLNNPKTQEAMAKNGKTEAELRAYYDKQQKNAEAPRILYTVEIPDDNGKNYLDWDGELTRKQADTIRKKLYDAVLARNDDYKGSEEYLAQDLSVIKYGSHIGDTYGTISDYLSSDKAASEFLHDLGYTGFKVHAAHNSSDKRYKNNWNYVIFNDKDLKMKDKVRFFRTPNGEAYGYTVGGKIYIDPRIATSETPIHEYAHLWAEALRKANPKEWQNVVELMKECKSVWEQVKKEYPKLRTDDEIADEVLAHYSGRRGAERLRQEAAKATDAAKGVLDKAAVVSGFGRMREAIKKAWKHIAEDILHIHFTTAEEVADKVMYDLLNKVNPNRFNLSKSVEEDKDLIAVHNLTEDKLKQSLELGGFPMPSIAITKSSMGHAEYGDISLLFGKDTINPSDSRNKVYSGDAWTPTFPHVSYKLDEKKLRDIYSRALKAGNLPFFDSARLHPENLKDRVDGNDSAKIIESGKKDYGMKQMFLSEKGNPVKGYVQKTVDKYSPERVELLQEILDKIGVEGLRNGKYEDELKQIVGSYRHVDLDSVKPFFAKLAMQSALRDAIDFAENGNKKVENDVEATQKEIDSRIAPKEYDQWLHDMLEGITEKKGIRNNTDPYTRSGDRLKWERLYDAVTLDNVLKAMKAQPAKSGGFFNSIFGASAKELSNLNEVREEAKRRIKSVPEEEFKAEKDKILSRLEKISLPSVERSNSISGAMDFVENVKDAVVHSHTPRGIYKYLSDIYPDMTIDVANEIADVVKDIQSMSTRYLEAKPYRAVGFDEVRAAVVPSDTEAKIVQQLKDKGIPVYTYEKGNAEERRQVVNDAAQEQSVKFHKAEFGNSKKAAENEVEAVNKRFNEELEKYKRGEVPIGTRFELGMPSKALESAGFPYLPISMRASLLSKKAGMERHPFEASDLRDLVKAMQMPIAIFKYSKDNMRNLIVDVKHGDKHFLVGITLDYKAGDIEVNSVSGLFPKESHEWIKWIQDGKAIRIDQKKKVLDLIDSLRTNPAESERIGLNLSSVAKIVEDFENPVIKGENLSFEGKDGSIKDVPTTPEETEESDVLYREVDDEEQKRLDKEPTVKVYRAMQLIDGKLYPPMAAKVNGSLVEPAEPGQWLRADEHPELAKNGLFTLNKGGKDASGKRLGSVPAAYNPYWHTSRSPLNDQFSSAYKRPNLVTVEVEIPKSELTSGYHADGAKDPVGEMSWHAGPVSSKLPKEKERKVILSRWCKVVRVVPDAEVADKIAGMLKGENISVPDNTVTPSLRRELEKRGVPITHTKMVEDWERKYPSTQSGLSREGNGAYTDEELSMINDPFVRMLGESHRSKRQQKEFANRERQNMYDAVKDMAEKLHLDNVEIVTMSLEMTDRSGKVHHPKGFYNKANDKIIIVIPNHRNIEDALQTLLHEGVAHYGLRQLFGSHFDTFLKNVYEAGDMDVRRRIADLAIRKYQGDFSVATEEYLASLAEDTDFEDMNASWWQKIKHMFLAMLHDLGFDNFAGTHMFTLSDNELRYILWRSYENLKEPGRYRSILGEAEDITMQNHLGVGNYAEDKLERDLRQAYNNLDAAEINYQNYEAKKEEDPFRYNPKTAAIYKESVDFWKDKIAELENKSEPLDTEDEFEKERQEREEDAKISNNSDTNVNNSENVTEPAAWGKKDLMSKAEQVSYGIDPDLLFRDTIDDDDNTARETYNAWADAAITKLREAWQDSMINVKNLQDAVLKQRDEKIEDYENAYNAENRSHGVSRAEAEYFDDVIYKPLLKTVNKTAKEAGVSVGDVTEYMMAKHGLERNRVFAERDANAAWKKYQEQQKAKYDEYAKTHPKGKLTQADFIKKSYDDFFNGYRERDYSGLTALTGTDNVQDAEAEAQRIVADMESRADTSDLWTKTWQATSWTLKKAFDSGIISRDNYDYVSKMFGYYIPLRGWDETTAGDIFDYVGSGAKDTAFSPTLHKAGGRKSQADNPLAYISQMAVSAIVQGNKNKVKQAFFNFVENHPTNLVSVSEMWYRNYGTVTAPDWREDVPYIPENATADEIADIIKKHDEDMEKLKQQGLATKQRGRLHLNVPVKKGQALEHHVEVMLNGKKYIMYINGNPRAAQALNGTRAHRASENSFESSRVANFGRKLAERYTSLSPAFTLSNALRDLTMAAITTLIKEDPKYAIRFRLNVAKLVGPARMFSLMRWYKKLGQSGLNGQNWLSDTQKYFYEFMTQGAETGFTSLKDIEDYKKDMAKEFGNMNQSVINPKRLFRGLKNGLEFANRCIEDMTRFAIYMASRQSGRSIAQSVKDAKNITLNFNRKGSGEMGNSTYRNLQIFINPAIQALQNIVKMAMDHPFKFGGVTGLVALVGVAQPLITQLLAGIFGGGDGDDDDWSPAEEYWKLPTWQRRNNFVFWIPGTKKFGMIPLAQEFRVFHGFGETLSTVLGNHSSENPGLEVLTQAADLLPLDFTGNNGNPLVNVAPTIVQPLLQIGFNTDFTGRPLYKDNDFNKYEPSFQKAYVGTPSWLIKSSQLINEVTGGNDHKQGAWERTKVGQYANNPAVIDHLLKGYYGGLYSFFAQLGGSIMKAASGKTPDVQEVPIVNRVITTPRESQQNGKQQLPDWYFDMVDEAKRTQNELSGYKRDTRDKKEGALNHIEDMTKSEDFKKEMQINALINIVNQIRAAQPSVAEPKNKEEAETKQELDNGLKTVLGKLNTIRTTGKPLTDDDMNDQ